MKRIFIIGLMLLIASNFIFAAGGQQAGGSTSSALTRPGDWKYKYPEPVTVTVGRDFGNVNYFEGESFENNIYTKWIKDTYNIVVKTGFLVPGAEYQQRVTLAIASGDLPDVMEVTNQLQLVEMAEGGMLEDLTGLTDKWGSPLYKACLESFGGLKDGFPSCFYNGKQYANGAGQSGGVDCLFWVREDWRLKLGLPEPKTLDDFIKLAKAFVDNDMAGNKSTVGLNIASASTGNYNTNNMSDPFYAEVGAYPRLWIDGTGGKITYGSIAPQAKEGLKAMRDMYASGVIAKDYVTRDHTASIAAGQIGVMLGSWWHGNLTLSAAMNNDPTVNYQPYTWTSAKTGKRYSFNHNFSVRWNVARKGYAYPEISIRFQNLCAEVRAFTDGKVLTNEEETKFGIAIPDNIKNAYTGRQGINWGAWPSGVQINFLDYIPRMARFEQTDLAAFKAGNKAGIIPANITMFENVVKYENGDKSVDAWRFYVNYKAKQFTVSDFGKIDYKKTYWPYSTETMKQRWANLTTLENLAYNQIIMGERPLDYFDTFVKEWLDQGGTRIIEEVNKQFGK